MKMRQARNRKAMMIHWQIAARKAEFQMYFDMERSAGRLREHVYAIHARAVALQLDREFMETGNGT